jgi:3-phosphoshikimate 1-carboxyvinyltransferase
MKQIPQRERVSGTVTAPPSKSYTARAILLAALTGGTTTVESPLDSDDTRYLVDALRKSGWEIGGSFERGLEIGTRVGMSAAEVELAIGNAGTAMRFLTGFLAFTPGRFILTGDRRMLERPVGDLVDALRSLGAEVEYTGVEGFPPLMIRGRRFRGGTLVSINAHLSSQFASALMLAGAGVDGGLDVRVDSLVSRPYFEMTADILRQFGATVTAIAPSTWAVDGRDLSADRYRVEGDYSSASYWFAAAAATGGRVVVENLRRESAQGDAKFLEVLSDMGCDIEWYPDKVVVNGPERLDGGRFDCNSMPDIVPTLAAIAPLASRPVEIVDVAHLRIKESDRIATTAEELRRLGVSVDEGDDSLTIRPGWRGDPVSVVTHGDHRIAMAFAIAGLARGGVAIEDEQVVSKSYPRFWRELDQLTAEG